MVFQFFEGETPESDSWIVQCEIISATMLGAQPQDEDFPLEDPDDIDPNHFEFFGYGQPGNGPAPPPNGPNAQNHFAEDQGNQVWAPWPNQNVAQLGQGHPADQHGIQPNMDEVPLLIPIQPVEAEQGGQENHVEEDALTMPVEEVIQNVQH